VILTTNGRISVTEHPKVFARAATAVRFIKSLKLN